jgi:hypothetical protein
VSGVGQSKLQRYGDAFLAVIADADEASHAPETLV